MEGGPNESMSIMYGTLLRKYEAVKDDYGLVSKRLVTAMLYPGDFRWI